MSGFHLISVGNSVIRHFQSAHSDADFSCWKQGDPGWKGKLEDRKFLQEIARFLSEDPKGRSGELNAFLKFCDLRQLQITEQEVYLVGTSTASNEIALYALRDYFKEAGAQIYEPGPFPGYFDTAVPSKAAARFAEGIVDLVDRLLYIARRKEKEGRAIYFNPTGGFKAHVVACSVAGFLRGKTVYYIHEEFQDIIVLPPLLYLPRTDAEVQLLKQLSNREPVSGEAYQRLVHEPSAGEAMDRLAQYHLVSIEREDGGSLFRIQITELGCLMLAWLS